MNIIFLDFDGVITLHHQEIEDVERRIKILSDICHEYDCKIVIEAACKGAINEETMEVEEEYINYIFSLFKKYNIDCIGRTPSVIRKYCDSSYTPIWKEDEIRLYLFRHPEILHYCVIDDDDLLDMYDKSDLDKVREHLVKTCFYSKNKDEEGLLEIHKEQVGKKLQLENEIRKFAQRRKVRKY